MQRRVLVVVAAISLGGCKLFVGEQATRPDESGDIAPTKTPPPIPPPARPEFTANKGLLLREFAIQPTLTPEVQATCPIPDSPSVEGLTDLLACRGGDQIVIDLSLGRRLEIIRRLLKSDVRPGEVIAAVRDWAQELDAANPDSTVPEAPIARLTLGYALLAGNADPDGLTWARPAIQTWQADPETRVLGARMWAAALASCTATGAPGICGVPHAYREELKMHMAVARRLGGAGAGTEVEAIRAAIASDQATMTVLGAEAQPPGEEPPDISSKRLRQEVRRIALADQAGVLRVFIDPVDGLLAVGHLDPSQHGVSLSRIIMPGELSDDTFEAIKPRLADGARASCPAAGRRCSAPAQGPDFGTEFQFVRRDDGRVYLQRIVYYMGQ